MLAIILIISFFLTLTINHQYHEANSISVSLSFWQRLKNWQELIRISGLIACLLLREC
jgi:hypothetical protein